MLTTLTRVIKYGFSGFFRNGWLSTATIAIVFLVLVGFSGLLMFNGLANIVLNDIQNKVDISVFFKLDAPEDAILNLQRSLESMPEVSPPVKYISKDKALEIFKERYNDNTKVSQALNQLDNNPLSVSLNIKARSLNDYQAIASYLDKETYKPIIDNVSYKKNKGVIEKIKKIKSTAEQGGLLLIIFISFVAALIIFNTIRLAIYSNREELGIMRLVGASNFFIRGPYLIEGIAYGLIASVLATIVISIITFYVSPYLNVFVSNTNVWSYYKSNLFAFFVYQILFGVGLGVLSSYIAVRKYLRI